MLGAAEVGMDQSERVAQFFALCSLGSDGGEMVDLDRLYHLFVDYFRRCTKLMLAVPMWVTKCESRVTQHQVLSLRLRTVSTIPNLSQE